MNWLHGLSRMFTIPRKVRNQIDKNPIVQAALPALLPGLVNSLSSTIDLHVNDAAANAALKDALAIALRQTFGGASK